MMEISEESLRKQLDALESLSSNFGKFADTQKNKPSSTTKVFSAYDSALKTTVQKLNQNVSSLSDTFTKLSGGAEQLIQGFHGLLRDVIGGEAISLIFKAGQDLANNYRKLTDIGQTFGGSMLEMGRQAGQSGLSIDEFSNMLKKNSTAAAVLLEQTGKSGVSLGSLQKAVRDNTRQFGFYGMSVDEITNLTGDYTETLRLQGRSASINNVETGKQISSLAQDISSFADVTGKSREEIMAATNSALRDVAYTSANLTDAQNKTATKAIAFMASLPGDAGPVFSKMLSQTIGYGSSIFSDQAQTFVQAGVPQVLGIMDQLAQKAKSGANPEELAGEFGQLQDTLKDANDGLRIQAEAGNESAKQALEYSNQISGLSREEFVKRMEQQKSLGGVTQFFTTIGDQLERLSGAFMGGTDGKGGLYGAIMGLEDSISSGNEVFKFFKDDFMKAGKWFGDQIRYFFDPKSNHLNEFKGVLLTTWHYFKDDFIPVVMSVVSIFKTLIGIISWVHQTLQGIFGEKLGTIFTGVTIAALYFAKTLYTSVMKFKNWLYGEDKVKINAAVVEITAKQINNGGGGGIGGEGGGNNRGGGGGGGRSTAANLAGKTEEELKELEKEAEKPGFFKRISNFFKRGNVASIAENALGMIGGGVGGDCCNGMLSSLQNLTDRVDFHGERAHANATGARGLAADANELEKATAEKLAETTAAHTAGVVGNAGLRASETAAEKLAAKAAEHAVTDVAAKATTKSAIKGLGKVAGKLAAEQIPLIGEAVGLSFAAWRLAHGDYVGAGLEAAGGFTNLANLAPGAGIAADVGIQGALAWHDAHAGDAPSTPAAPPTKLSGHYRSGGRGGLIFVPDTVAPAAPSPATPSEVDENNPYKDLSESELKTKMEDVTATIDAIRHQESSGTEIIKHLMASTKIQEDLKKLMTEQHQMQAVAEKIRKEQADKQIKATKNISTQ